VAFAAPLVEGVAGSAASAAGAGAADGAGAGAARAGAGAAGARGTTRTAAGRADQLHGSRAPRYKARRALTDEYGATAGQADDLLDAAASRAPAGTPPASSAPTPRSGTGMPQLGRTIGTGVNASGGFVLGALAYVLFLVYLRGGTPAVASWLRAKFLNRVDGATPLPATTYQSTAPTVAASLRVAPGGGAPALTTPPTSSTTSTGRTWNT
jgi:hypothetical protein